MAWNWLLTLAPVADDIFKSVTKIIKKKQNADLLTTEISKLFSDLYTQSVGPLARDVTIISVWKPVVARAQAFEAIARSWQQVVALARKEKTPTLALNVVSTKNVEGLRSQVDELRKILADEAKNAKISWAEGGGVDIEAAVAQIGLDLDQLEKVTKQFEGHVADGKPEEIDVDELFHLDYALTNVQARIVVIMGYWDNFMRDLSKNAAAAPQHFAKGLPDKVKKAIEAEYDNTKWSDVLDKVYKAVNQ